MVDQDEAVIIKAKKREEKEGEEMVAVIEISKKSTNKSATKYANTHNKQDHVTITKARDDERLDLSEFELSERKKPAYTQRRRALTHRTKSHDGNFTVFGRRFSH